MSLSDDMQNGVLDRLASAAAMALDVRAVAITLVEGKRQTCVGAYGFARHDRTLSSAFCFEVAVASRPVIVQDARSRSAPTTLHAWGRDLVAYAGVPLAVTSISRLGAIGACASSRRAWQDRDLEILRAFGDAASVVLELESRLARVTVEYASLEAHISEATSH